MNHSGNKAMLHEKYESLNCINTVWERSPTGRMSNSCLPAHTPQDTSSMSRRGWRGAQNCSHHWGFFLLRMLTVACSAEANRLVD